VGTFRRVALHLRISVRDFESAKSLDEFSWSPGCGLQGPEYGALKPVDGHDPCHVIVVKGEPFAV